MGDYLFELRLHPLFRIEMLSSYSGRVSNDDDDNFMSLLVHQLIHKGNSGRS